MTEFEFDTVLHYNVYIRFHEDGTAESMPPFSLKVDAIGNVSIHQEKDHVFSSAGGQNAVVIRFPADEYNLTADSIVIRNSSAMLRDTRITASLGKCRLYDAKDPRINLELFAVAIDCDEDTVYYLSRQVYHLMVGEDIPGSEHV